MKSMRGSWRTAKNTEELEGPNADLRNKKEETHRCEVAAEVRRVSLVKSGWCSGLSWWRRGDLRQRRWRSSSGRETARGRRWTTEEVNGDIAPRQFPAVWGLLKAPAVRNCKENHLIWRLAGSSNNSDYSKSNQNAYMKFKSKANEVITREKGKFQINPVTIVQKLEGKGTSTYFTPYN